MPGNTGDPGCWSRSLASLGDITHADGHNIANDLSNTIKKCIGKGYTFIWDSYVHKFEPFDRGEAGVTSTNCV